MTIIRFIFFTAVAVLLATAACNRKSSSNSGVSLDPNEVATLEIKLDVVGQKTMESKIDLTANVEGYEVTALSSRLEGYVDKVNAMIGDEVKKDMPLIELKIPEMQKEFLYKQNLVKQATSLAHSKSEKVKQATAQILSSEALINFRQAALARMQSLGQRGSIQREKIEEAGYELAAARAQKIAVEADIKAAQAEALAANVGIEVAKADLAIVQEMQNYLNIVAPFDGIITERNVDPGAYALPADKSAGPMMRIESNERLRITVYVPVKNVPELDVGDKLVIHRVRSANSATLAKDATGKEFSVTRFSKSLDRKLRMMRAEIDINNSVDPRFNRRLFQPGDFLSVTLLLESHDELQTCVPQAVGSDEQGAFVVVVDGGRCQRKRIEVKADTPEVIGFICDESLVGKSVVAKNPSDFSDGQVFQLPHTQ